MPKPQQHPIFRTIWWGCNVLLAAVLLALVYAAVREFSVRRYLDGFSDAIAPSILPAEPKVQALLDWMRIEPSRAVAPNPNALPSRDPYITLNYEQLLRVCGTATNAFLNLAREDNLQVRRLLLLNHDGKTKHVVAEVLIDGRWVVVDPTYHVILRDKQGHPLTRQELQNPAIFEQAANSIPNYPREYTYERSAHIRLARVPLFENLHLRRVLDGIYPVWDEAVDWSLLLERKSFFYLVITAAAALFFLLLRQFLAWYADSMLRIPRFHFREHMIRASAAFFSTPEIKE